MLHHIVMASLAGFLTLGTSAYAADDANGDYYKDSYSKESSGKTESAKKSYSKDYSNSTETNREEEHKPFYSYTSPVAEHRFPENLWMFAGFAAGGSSLFAVPTSELTKSGYQVNVKASTAYYLSHHFVTDLGVGFFTNNMTSANSTVQVITNAFVLEASIRYRITPRLQLGPVFDLLLGSDVSFSELKSGINSGSAGNLLGGLRASYETNIERFIVRFGAQGLTNLTITQRNIFVYQADLQFGFPFSSSTLLPF